MITFHKKSFFGHVYAYHIDKFSLLCFFALTKKLGNAQGEPSGPSYFPVSMLLFFLFQIASILKFDTMILSYMFLVNDV